MHHAIGIPFFLIRLPLWINGDVNGSNGVTYEKIAVPLLSFTIFNYQLIVNIDLPINRQYNILGP